MNGGRSPSGSAALLAEVVDLAKPQVDVESVVEALLEQAAAGAPTDIGFPGATDIDYSPLMKLFGRIFNNVGDPGTDPGSAAHTKVLERAVIDWCADLFGLPAGDRWGYVTAGGTEGNLADLLAARRRYPNALFYFSSAAHYSIPKIVVEMLGLPAVVVGVDARGEMDYTHLDALAWQHRHRAHSNGGRPAAVMIATAGTTMTEAVDDTATINAIFEHHGIARHVHVDAALSGIPLALEGSLSLASGIDSVSFSGHKFLGTPVPCGGALMRDSIRRAGRHIDYTATPDTTVSGSRCGQAAALLWYGIGKYGYAGHRERAVRAREVAAYTTARLTEIGWPAWRHPHGFTVVLKTPPAAVTRKWLLAGGGPDGRWCHSVCVPGIVKAQMGAFVDDLAHAIAPSAGAIVPPQRAPLLAPTRLPAGPPSRYR